MVRPYGQNGEAAEQLRLRLVESAVHGGEAEIHHCGVAGGGFVGKQVGGPGDARRTAGVGGNLDGGVVVREAGRVDHRPHEAVVRIVDGDDELASDDAVREGDDAGAGARLELGVHDE